MVYHITEQLSLVHSRFFILQHFTFYHLMRVPLYGADTNREPLNNATSLLNKQIPTEQFVNKIETNPHRTPANLLLNSVTINLGKVSYSQVLGHILMLQRRTYSCFREFLNVGTRRR